MRELRGLVPGPADDDRDPAIFNDAPGNCSPEASRAAWPSRLNCTALQGRFRPEVSGSMPNGLKLYGYGERPPFVSFQCDLLR
jgi:hypothetical protein